MKGLVSLLIFFALPSTVQSAECHSVAGMINGQRATSVRTVELKLGRIYLSGKMAGKPMPSRTLACKSLAKGVLCEGTFEGVLVSVMTNRKRMLESVTDPSTHKQLAAFAYTCNQVMKP